MYEPFCISVLFLDIGIATFGGAGWWLLRKTWQVLAATDARGKGAFPHELGSSYWRPSKVNNQKKARKQTCVGLEVPIW